jgi:predicted CopG family antitoxin
MRKTIQVSESVKDKIQYLRDKWGKKSENDVIAELLSRAFLEDKEVELAAYLVSTIRQKILEEIGK